MFRPIDTIVRVSLRTLVHDVPPQDIITRDNVSVKVNAVVYFRVIDPRRAIVEVENYTYATSQLAQTTLRSVLGQAELDDLLSERDRLNQQLQQILDNQTDPWGIKVSAVEVKHVDLPAGHAARDGAAGGSRAREARQDHPRRGRADRVREAGAGGGRPRHREPVAMTLRYLQTLTEIAAEQNSTIVFPLPDRPDRPAASARRIAAPATPGQDPAPGRPSVEPPTRDRDPLRARFRPGSGDYSDSRSQ